MAWRGLFTERLQRWLPLTLTVAAFAGAVAIAFLFPAKIAAVCLGVTAGGALSFALSKRNRHAAGTAVLWIAATIVSDAAYAKLNDQAPITLANALTKLIDGAAKLAEPLLNEITIGPGGVRAKIAAAAPDFVWALILTLLFGLLAYRLYDRDGGGR